MFVFSLNQLTEVLPGESEMSQAGGGRGRHSDPGRQEKQAAWAGICDLPAPQILRHCGPAAEQISSEWFQLLPQPHHRGQRLCVEVQHGILLLDVNQWLFINILQKLLGLLGHLQNKRWSSVLVNPPVFHSCLLCPGTAPWWQGSSVSAHV